MRKVIGLLIVIFIASAGQVFAENKVYKVGDTGPAGGIIVSGLKIGGAWHYIEASKKDAGRYTWEEANEVCEKSTEGNVNNWVLPSIDVLNLIYETLFAKGKVDFKWEQYWSSSKGIFTFYWIFNFEEGKPFYEQKYHRDFVRCVRDF